MKINPIAEPKTRTNLSTVYSVAHLQELRLRELDRSYWHHLKNLNQIISKAQRQKLAGTNTAPRLEPSRQISVRNHQISNY